MIFNLLNITRFAVATLLFKALEPSKTRLDGKALGVIDLAGHYGHELTAVNAVLRRL